MLSRSQLSRLQARLQSLAPIPLRLLLGFGLAYHGFPKVFTTEGSASFAGMLTGLGVPFPEVSANAIGVFELIGGILLIFGVGVRVIASLGVIEMVVAALLVHLPAGFNFLHIIGTTADGAARFGIPGYEVNVLYIAGFLSLIASGRGHFSLPHADDDLATRPVARARAEERELQPTP